MIAENFARLDIDIREGLSVVIDASESARQYEDAILRTGAQLLERLPSSTSRKLFFLGNPKPYNPDEFNCNAPQWWLENQSRISILAPLIDNIDQGKIIILGSGPIYDLEDWRDNPLKERLILVNTGSQSMAGDVNMGKELLHPELTELLHLVYNPIVGVTISGQGFLPYYWNNPEYSITREKGIALTAAPVKNPVVTLGFWGNTVRARVFRESGEQQFDLKPAQNDSDDRWEPLTGEEREVFNSTVTGEPFRCPVCSRSHPPGEIRCYAHGSLLGETVYPSLGNRRGIAVLKQDNQMVMYRFHPVNCIKIGEGKAAMWHGGSARIYEYDPAQEEWLDKGKLHQYYRTEDSYLLFF